jgi:hypothetical protein
MPDAVKMRTKRCQDSNDEFTEWLNEAIEVKDDEYLTLNAILGYYGVDARGSRATGPFKQAVVDFLLKKFKIPESNHSNHRLPGQKKVKRRLNEGRYTHIVYKKKLMTALLCYH